MLKRKTNLEMLRIISMIFIVFFHAASDIDIGCGVTGCNNAPFSINQIISLILGSWGLMGVGCFFIISDYFMIENDGAYSKRISKVVIQTIFWSVVAYCIGRWIGLESCNSFRRLVKSILSPFISEYWFVTTYIFVCILSPYLNSIISKLEMSEYKKLVIIMTIIMPVYSMFFPKSSTLCDLGLGIYYYLLVGYLKQNPKNIVEKNAKTIFVLTIAITLVLEVFFSAISQYTRISKYAISNIMGRWSIFQIIAAVALYYIFKNMDIKQSKTINTIATSTLGIYLIHESVLEPYVWNDIFRLDEWYQTRYFVWHYLWAVFVVFVIAALLSLIYKKLIEKPLYCHCKICDKIFDKIDNMVRPHIVK